MLNVEATPLGDNWPEPLRPLEERLRSGGLSASGAGPAVRRELTALLREWFDTEGMHSWPPLAPSTQRARARAGLPPAHPILVASGRLRESIVDPRGRGSQDAAIRMSANMVEQATLVPYSIFHHLGTRRMPARPPMGLPPGGRERLEAVYAEWLFTGEAPRGVDA